MRPIHQGRLKDGDMNTEGLLNPRIGGVPRPPDAITKTFNPSLTTHYSLLITHHPLLTTHCSQLTTLIYI